MNDDSILRKTIKELRRVGVETSERALEESGKVFETIITGKELLGLERTMTDIELEDNKRREEIKSQEEILKIKKGMKKDDSQKSEVKTKEIPRNIEEELAQLRRQKERDEEEKQKYYEKEKQEKERQKQAFQEEYDGFGTESVNPSKRKKSRGSAFVNKKQHKPDTSDMSATAEFKGNKVQ